MSPASESDAAVVAGGPVGLAAANLLAARGHRVLLVEQNASSSDEPRAIMTQAGLPNRSSTSWFRAAEPPTSTATGDCCFADPPRAFRAGLSVQESVCPT
jgi:flavin-dependent dehydrogenase